MRLDDTRHPAFDQAAPSAPVVSYGYDLDSRLISVSDTSASITPPASSASYAASLVYDQFNRPLGVNWNPAPSQTTPTAASSASFAFAYDATNRRINQSATDNSWWNYPTAATKVSYSANNLNQYTAVGSVSPTYDGNGDLTYDGSFTYCYDAESRLTGIVTGSCGSPTSTVATYAYDAQGRRKSKTVGSTTTIYVTDTDNREVLGYNGTSGAIGNWYAYAPANAFGPDAVLNQMNVTASTRGTLIPDLQGSIIGALDASSGTLTKTGYQAYGENPSLSSGSYRYTACRFDPETAGSTSQPSGLYYYRARMYSPAWGRFMQVDPVGLQSGNNLYRYVGNDPLNLADPFGLAGILLSFGGTISAGNGSALITNPDTGQPTNAPTGAVASLTATFGGFINTNSASSNYLAATVGGAVTAGAGIYGTVTSNGSTGVASATFPQNQPSIIGGEISKGFSIGYTTANDIAELAGPSNVTEYNFLFLQFQISNGTNAAGQSVSTYSLSPCLFCIGTANYATQTYSTAPIAPGIPLPAVTSPAQAAESLEPQVSAAPSQPAGIPSQAVSPK